MKPSYFILIGVAVAMVLRLIVRVRRRRQASDGLATGGSPAMLSLSRGLQLLSTRLEARIGDTWMVALREIRERVHSRIFRIGTLVIVLVVAGAIIIPTLSSKSSNSETMCVSGALGATHYAVVVDAARRVGVSVKLVDTANVGSARAGLNSGQYNVCIAGSQLLVNKAISPTDTSSLASFVHGVSEQLGIQRAYSAAGLTPGQEQQLAAAAPLPVVSLHPASTQKSTKPTSIIGVVLIFVMLTQYNTWTLMGVMQEKSSRVVEVLLAALRPIQLLAGKVLGIGLVAMSQALLVVVVALILSRAVGADLTKGTGPIEVFAALLWLLLGYAFYSWVYAAAGSMAERQDQVQTLAFPLSLPIIVGYILALTAAGSGHASTLLKVLAYFPPTAPFGMTVLVDIHGVVWWQFVASVLTSLAGTALVARFAATIYRRAVLRTGSRLRWREVLAARV